MCNRLMKEFKGNLKWNKEMSLLVNTTWLSNTFGWYIKEYPMSRLYFLGIHKFKFIIAHWLQKTKLNIRRYTMIQKKKSK